MNMESEGGLVVRGRVEIDMRQPFRSVKEAISLFGEKVLTGQINANKLKEMQTKGNTEEKQNSKFETVKTELEVEGSKPNSEKAKEEEKNLMAYYLNSLKQELEQTKREIQQIKSRESDHKPLVDPEIEELKFVENTSKVEVKTPPDGDDFEFQKKRSVKFASPPLLTKVIVSNDIDDEKKVKRKPLISLIGALFSKKKGNQKSGSSIA